MCKNLNIVTKIIICDHKKQQNKSIHTNDAIKRQKMQADLTRLENYWKQRF